MNDTFLRDRITATKAEIIIYEDAVTAIGVGGVQSYTLDTGQSRQTVTKLNLTELRKALDSLYNRLVILEARLNGGNSVTVRPAW